MLHNNLDGIDVWFSFWFLFIGRILDVLSTYIITPTLKLEGNPLARRFGWRFILLSIALAAAAFVSPFAGVVLGVVSYMVAYSNILMLPLIRRAGGEDALTGLLANSNQPFRYWRWMFNLVSQSIPGLSIGIALLFEVRNVGQGLLAAVAWGFVAWRIAIIYFRTLALLRFIYKRKCAARHLAGPAGY